MQVVDWKPMTTAQVDQYCVQATGGPLKVTLVWADPFADVSASVSLVNDLDLTVHADSLSGYSLVGNGAPDHANNVEQVLLLLKVFIDLLHAALTVGNKNCVYSSGQGCLADASGLLLSS